MPINVQNLLIISKDLLNRTPQTEDYFRSSSNRAYYCAIHACSESAKSDLGLTPKNGMHNSFGHKELYNLFLNHKPSLVVPTRRDKDINTIGYLLKQTRDLRVHADYKSKSFSSNDAQDAINHADEIYQRSLKMLAFLN